MHLVDLAVLRSRAPIHHFRETQMGVKPSVDSMNPDTVLVLDDGTRMILVPGYSELNKNMRHTRPWYILPFLVNLGVIFSASWLITEINQNAMDETFLALPCWVFYATVSVCAPTALAVSRLMPDPSVALTGGGLLTSAGLLWTGLNTGSSQLLSFGVVAGAGISLSLQATCVSISPYFIRKNVTASVMTLLLAGLVMMIYPLLRHVEGISSDIFIYLSVVVFVSSIIPPLHHIHINYKSIETGRTAAPPSYEKDEKILADNSIHKDIPEKETEDSVSPYCGCLRQDFKRLFCEDGWAPALVSVFVWLSWGAGVDTTWLSMGWNFHYFSSSAGLASLQLLLCFILLAIKMGTEFTQPSLCLYRSNLASNYMQLGLLGAGGVILCLFPEFTQAFHNHLLFTVGFALQYDDLSDLYLVRKNNHLNSVHMYKLINYNIGMEAVPDTKTHNVVQSFCCFLCHMISLLLMSILAMILGIQVAHLLAILSSVPPFSFLCTRPGLLLISMAAVCTSLVKPDSWLEGRRNIIF